MRNQLPKQQRGVALITAVLIVALVTAAAVAMASRQQLDIRRSANIFNNDIAYQFALGAEDFARNMLEWDADPKKGNPKVDHLGEDWAQKAPPMVVEGAVLSGSIQDLQGRINLNALLKADGTRNQEMMKRFERLLRLLDLNQEIAEAVIDWVDNEGVEPTGVGGAEDDYYMLQTPPYRTPHGMIASSSELLLVKGVDYEAYQLLLPHVSALPDRETKINVNTASAEVLASLAENLAITNGEALIDARPKDGFDKISSFTVELNRLGNDNGYLEDFLDVQSSYFLVDAMAEFDESIAQLHSLVHRNNTTAGVRVVMRSRGAY